MIPVGRVPKVSLMFSPSASTMSAVAETLNVSLACVPVNVTLAAMPEQSVPEVLVMSADNGTVTERYGAALRATVTVTDAPSFTG